MTVRRVVSCLAMVAVVAGCTRHDGPQVPAAAPGSVAWLTTRLPVLPDLPGKSSVHYETPPHMPTLYADNWPGCGRYPVLGDMSRPAIRAEYDEPVRPGRVSLVNVVLRMADAGENVADELAKWTAQCGPAFSVGRRTYESHLDPHDARMPGDTAQLTVLPTKGSYDSGPAGVRIVSTVVDGVVLEAWVTAEGAPEAEQVPALARVVDSFLKRSRVQSPPAGPVAQWSPADLSAQLMLPVSFDHSTELQIEVPMPGRAVTPGETCADDPIALPDIAGVPSDAWPARLEPLVKFTGAAPAMVYREREGFDGLAAVRQWIARCHAAASAAPVPEECAGAGWQPFLDATPDTRLEGESVIGYRRGELQVGWPKSAGSAGSCAASAVMVQVVRVAGLLIWSQLAAPTRAPQSPDFGATSKLLDQQLTALIGRIHDAE